MVEVVRALAEEAGQLDDVGHMALPAHIFAGGMQQIVYRRLSRLQAEDYPLLRLAAVAGRQIDRAVLREADTAVDIDGWLVTCANAAILEVFENRWRFAHDKLREGVLAELPIDERRSLHLRVGEAIEPVYAADLSAHYVNLSYQFGEARDMPREYRYARLAGEQAAAQYANADAVRYLSRALDLIGATNVAARFGLLSARERVHDLWEIARHRQPIFQPWLHWPNFRTMTAGRPWSRSARPTTPM